jgi:hypothetical protein
MTTKLDAPKSKGELTYSNTGSCARLINYEISNKEKLGDENHFFTLDKDKITPEEAKALIDFNVKGLKKEEEKFYSFSLNPSDAELEHIKNDKNKVKNYVRAAMSNYAENFKDKGLKKEDIVWTAIIHDTRYYTHDDIKKLKETNEKNNFKVGDKKPGNNMHIHIIVSRKDASMGKTLTIRGRKGKENFSLFDFQKKNQETFQAINNYRVGVNLYGEMQTKSILSTLGDLNGKMPLDKEIVLKIAAKHNYSGNINYNLKDLYKSINRGEVINDPYKFIEVGKKQYNNELKLQKEVKEDFAQGLEDLFSVIGTGKTSEKNKGEIPDISDYARKRKKKKKLIL